MVVRCRTPRWLDVLASYSRRPILVREGLKLAACLGDRRKGGGRSDTRSRSSIHIRTVSDICRPAPVCIYSVF
jgi:hypothetical protein